jgi:hypothetical protein
LHGYPRQGRWHRPAIEVVSAYVDQFPPNDLSRGRAKEFGFPIHRTIAEALRCGGDRLAVDAVLIIGEHGNYPTNKLGQKEYPRYEFFRQVVDVFRKDGRSVPVFNDKHLSWRWEWAREMVDTARKLGFPFLAGSSLPVTWRMPAVSRACAAARPWPSRRRSAIAIPRRGKSATGSASPWPIVSSTTTDSRRRCCS